MVLFHPAAEANSQAARPHGQVDREGGFFLSTDSVKDGAPAGDYVVTLDWRKTVPGHGPTKGPSLVPPEYGTPGQSSLRATVKAESNNLDPFQIMTRQRARPGLTRRSP
jgi:hypothetical protein